MYLSINSLILNYIFYVRIQEKSSVSYLHQFFPYFPRENSGIVPLHLLYPRLDLRGCYPRLATTNHSRSYGTGLLIPIQNFRNASVRNAKLPRDHAGTNTSRCHFDDFQPYVIRKRSAVDENASQLIHTSLSCREHFISLYAFDSWNMNVSIRDTGIRIIVSSFDITVDNRSFDRRLLRFFIFIIFFLFLQNKSIVSFSITSCVVFEVFIYRLENRNMIISFASIIL